MSKQLHEDVLKTQEVQKSQPFSFVIPPPNVTRKLYLNHTWGITFKVNESQRSLDSRSSL